MRRRSAAQRVNLLLGSRPLLATPAQGGSPQDDGSFGHACGEDLGDEVAKAGWVDGLASGAQFIERPPAAGPDAVGLGGAGRVDVGSRETCEVVPLDLADIEAADLVVLAALGDLRTEVAVITEAGEVALPYAGSRTQTLALAQSLIARLHDVSTMVTSGSPPPMAHWEAMESLRERYALPAIIKTADALPDRLMA
ncbi:hypothetical protein ACIBF6_36475 [Streptosporangium amethystogenes]|uniref:hypothetical protein n=1 Tax=Streptosporangium amethystogenes TaxID=2002 RepID=UPI0037AD01D5